MSSLRPRPPCAIALATLLICAGPPIALAESPSGMERILEQFLPYGERGEALAPPRESPGAVTGTERIEEEAIAEEPEQKIRLGGALRFNLGYREFDRTSRGRRGESGLDLFRLNADGQLGNILFSAEYRFYPFMNTIHHGWLGYEFADQSQLQFGIHQAPFGLLPYPAHNFWFGVPYYVGLGDNYDMGVKYLREDGPWRSHLAFYKNEELNDASNLDRYAFDLVRVGDQHNEAVNQFNARLAYVFGQHTACELELGGSAQYAQLYNAVTDRRGDHWAAAAHLDARCGRWNLQLQGVSYEYSPTNPPGVTDDVVRVGAFGASYDIDADAEIAVVNLAYNVDPPWQAIDQLLCYNNYSRLFKSLSGAIDSQINTLGCAIGSGPLFTYIDWVFASNMAFIGEGSMAAGGDDRWRNLLNINIGFYW